MERVAFTLGFALIGLIDGYFVYAHAMAMCGFGHGWCSACQSAISLACGPLAGMAWAWNDKRWSLLVSVPVLLAGIYSDFKIWFDTRAEGVDYLKRMWEDSSHIVLMWGLLFGLWQVWAAISVRRSLRTKDN